MIASVGDLVAQGSWLPAKDVVTDVSAADLTLAVTKRVLGSDNIMSSFKIVDRDGTTVAQM